MIEEILKVSIGVIIPPLLAWIATRIPNVRHWLSHNSPSYLIIIAAGLSGLTVTIGFAGYLDYIRRQEIISLNKSLESANHVVTEARIARDQGYGGHKWDECGKHAQIALDHGLASQSTLSNRIDYRLKNYLP